MEIEKYKYWILFSILFIALIWTIGKKREAEYFETFENENKSDDTNIAMVKLTSLLGLLLDNQEFANAIIINNNLTSIRDLVEKNRKKIKLNLTPILRNEQFRVVTRFLLLNDIYYTINPNDKKNEERIITFSRKEELVKPKELYKTPDEEDAQLGSFRKNFHLNKKMYLEYDWIADKSKFFIRNYGLSMLAQAEANLKEVYDDNYWQGMKYLAKSDLYDIPINTLLYIKGVEQIFFKTDKDEWFITPIEVDKNITILQRIISDPTRNWEYWTALKTKKGGNEVVKSNQLPNGEYFLIRTSSSFNLTRLYRKIDEMSQNNFFNLNPEYDKKINLPSGLDNTYTQIERMNLLKKWIEKKTSVENEQKMLLENIIFDLNHRVINIFDDILCFLIFYQHSDFTDVYLDNYLRLDSSLNSWWSGIDIKSVLINGTGLGQCFLPANFSISKIQESPPIYKFIYNRNLYHTFWDPLINHVDDMKKFLTEKFKSSVVSEIAPVARFCLFNNPSLREYLSKYVACNADKCESNLTSMKEPERCGALKLKYQELMNNRMGYKCFYRSKTDSNPTDKSNIDNDALKKMSQEEEDKYVDQLFGFNNILLLDLIQYALKYHKCQIESISIKDCQGLTSKIDTTNQKDDLKMDEIVIDRQNDLYSLYDTQLTNYNKILKEQEIKKLEPLNILSNLEEKESKKRDVTNFSIFNKVSDDFYNIINDLTNIKLDGNYSNSKTQIEPFDNQIIENLDLNEATIKDYKDRLQRQIQGISSENTIGYFNKIINLFYQIVDILTKESRIATSGMVLVLISLAFYFIDITS